MNIKQYLFVVCSLLAFVSCSENDESEPEFADWQNRNDAYFLQQYNAYMQEYKSKGEASDKVVIPNWSQPSSLSLEEVEPTRCILVEKVDSDVPLWTEETPFYTDSVAVHYRGNLIPTEHYPEGYEFDRSFMSKDRFDPDVDVPAQFKVNGSLIDGFRTAVQHMHRGDAWRVTIPYNLGYGSKAQNEIPAYSTLIFEIYLADFWTEEEGDRY